MKKIAIASAALLAASLTSVGAQELRPDAARSIALGNVTGAAYYTVEPEGFRVVATLQAGMSGEPVRFVSTLTDGQVMTIEVPAVANHGASDLTIRRTGDRLEVQPGSNRRAELEF